MKGKKRPHGMPRSKFNLLRRVCGRKVKFRSAQDVPPAVVPYKCPFCNGYHGANPLAREPKGLRRSGS